MKSCLLYLLITTCLVNLATAFVDCPSSAGSATVLFVSCDAEQVGGLYCDCRLLPPTDGTVAWTRRSGRTPSGSSNAIAPNGSTCPVTGPWSAAEGSYYLFTEASGTKKGGIVRMLLDGNLISQAVNWVCVKFQFNMNGYHIGTLRVVAHTTTDDAVYLWNIGHNQTANWYTAAVDINATTVDQVYFEGVMQGGVNGDTAIDDVTIDSGRCSQLTDNVLWECHFETANGAATMCDVTQSASTITWQLRSGMTPSALNKCLIDGDPQTGPLQAKDGAYYVYMEASGQAKGSTAIFTTPPLPSGDACVTFAYSLNGFHVASLSLCVLPSGQTTPDCSLWTDSGNKGSGDWLWASVTVHLSQGDRVAVKSIVGNGWSGDIAVDAVQVLKGACISS